MAGARKVDEGAREGGREGGKGGRDDMERLTAGGTGAFVAHGWCVFVCLDLFSVFGRKIEWMVGVRVT